MKINKLIKKEEKLVDKYNNVLIKSIKKSIKKKGFTKSALKDHSKVTKKIGKEMVNSGLGLGLEWLNDLVQK